MKFLVITILFVVSVILATPVVTEIWSDSLGAEIGIKVWEPSGLPRFATGAPVIVDVPGGWSQSGFSSPETDLLDEGMAAVSFLLPGDSREGVATGGFYDLRGPNCLATLKDVIRFAAGRIPDTGGDYIGDLFPVEIDTGNVGLFMGSNGGNLGIVTLSIHGAELEGMVDYLVGYENPSSPQTCLPDLGVHESFISIDGDSNGIPGDDYKNPWFIAYGDTICAVDYSRIAWDSTATTVFSGFVFDGAVFLDGNLNGTYDRIIVDSSQTPDINGNGVIDTTEDFLFYCLQGPDSLYYYSTPVVDALYSLLGPSDWPEALAPPESVEIFWHYRASVLHYDNLSAYFPDLAYMPLFSVDDHVQVTPGKVHIRHAYNGFTRNGLWVRLNPDRAYDLEFFPPSPDYPDNPANFAPFNWLAIVNWSITEDAPLAMASVSGVLEMADRTHYNVWNDPNLDYVLEWRPSDKPPIYASIVSHSEEPPGTPDYGDNPAIFAINRSALLEFANMLFDNDIRLNWQSEWNFTRGVALHDDGSGTGGENIVVYMHDSLGFEIDPHAHESIYNYADVAHFIEDLSVTPTNTVGGFCAWPPASSILEQFFDPIEADSFPAYIWTPEILWGAATIHHVDEETLYISGIWKPRDADHFFEHDESRLPNISGYTRDWFGVSDLLQNSRVGFFDPERIYTAAVFVGQGRLNSAVTDTFERDLHDMEEYYQTDWLRWRTLLEIAQTWRDEYDSIPNMFWFGGGTFVDDPQADKPEEISICTYPNPFNSSVTISLTYGSESSQTLSTIKIFDINGRIVAEIPANGSESAKPSSTNASGACRWQPDESLGSGIYLVRAKVGGNETTVKRVVYLK